MILCYRSTCFMLYLCYFHLLFYVDHFNPRVSVIRQMKTSSLWLLMLNVCISALLLSTCEAFTVWRGSDDAQLDSPVRRFRVSEQSTPDKRFQRMELSKCLLKCHTDCGPFGRFDFTYCAEKCVKNGSSDFSALHHCFDVKMLPDRPHQFQ